MGGECSLIRIVYVSPSRVGSVPSPVRLCPLLRRKSLAGRECPKPQKRKSKMTVNHSRRQIVRSAAWTAPVVLATATVPAYAASYCPEITVHSEAVENSAGEVVHNIFFTAPQPWGEATLEVTGGHLLLEPRTVSHMSELELLAFDTGGLTVTLRGAGCEPTVWSPPVVEELEL